MKADALAVADLHGRLVSMRTSALDPHLHIADDDVLATRQGLCVRYAVLDDEWSIGGYFLSEEFMLVTHQYIYSHIAAISPPVYYVTGSPAIWWVLSLVL